MPICNIYAQIFSIDEITYEIIENKLEVAVVQISSEARDCVLPESVNYETVNYKVSKIHSVGYQSYNLKSLTIPQTISVIDNYAFRDCRNLSSIVFEDTDEPLTIGHCYQSGEGGGPFYLCPLKQAYIGRDISIPYIFYGDKFNFNDAIFPQKYFESVSFGENVSDIAVGMFAGCKKLQSIELPKSITKIGDYAFADCEGLTEFRMPQSLKYIGTSTFEGCIGLNTIELPNSVETLGSCVFQNCSKLSSIILSSSLISIPYNAFAGAPIKSIRIPNSVTEISNGSFQSCTNLKEVIIEDGSKPLYFKGSPRAFFDCNLESAYVGRNLSYDESPFYYQPNLQSCIIGNSVTIIPMSFLSESNSIEHINLPHSITTIENGAFHGCTSLSSINMSDGLLSIGDEVFDGCTSLSSISIPEKVNEIKEKTFRGCISLKEVRIDDGDTELTIPKGCFLPTPLESIYFGRNINSVGLSINGSYSIFNCEQTLNRVKIGKNVSEIPNNAFEGCVQLDSILLPHSVKLIGANSFKDCTKLSKFIFGDSVETVESCAFENCALTKVVLPKRLKDIGYYAFRNNENLHEVVFGDSLKSIGDGAFSNCINLANVILPANLQSIGNSTFKNCKKISVLRIPLKVETIGRNAFFGCPLRDDSFIVPKSVKAIGSNSFESSHFKKIIIEDCDDVLWLTAHDGEEDYGSAFKSCLTDSVYIGRDITYSTDKFEQTVYGFANNIVSSVSFGENVTYIPYEFFKGCRNLKSISLPDNIVTIGMCSFENCSSLTEFNMGNGVTKVGKMAFSNCKKLTSIKFGNAVSEIMEGAFSDCRISNAEFNENLISLGKEAFKGSSLRNIVLPSSLKTIEESAFSNNGKIAIITCKATAPPSTAINAFDDIVKMGTPLYVPAESLSRYEKAICWRDFYTIIGGETGFDDICIDTESLEGDVDVFSINGGYIYHGSIKDCYLKKGVYLIKSNNTTKKILIQ